MEGVKCAMLQRQNEAMSSLCNASIQIMRIFCSEIGFIRKGDPQINKQLIYPFLSGLDHWSTIRPLPHPTPSEYV